MTDDLVTITEIAKRTGYSRPTLYKWIANEKKLKPVSNVKGTNAFKWKSFKKWMKENGK